MVTLSKMQLAQVKRTNLNTKQLVNKNLKLKEKIDKLMEEYNANEEMINMWETPVIQMTGYTSSEFLHYMEVGFPSEELTKSSFVEEDTAELISDKEVEKEVEKEVTKESNFGNPSSSVEVENHFN